MREMRCHCANGLVVLPVCACLEEDWLQICALLAAMRLFHSCFFTHSINQGGQTCSMEESFAENQKHQQAAKPVCSVKTNTVKSASFTLNDLL